MRLIAKEAVRVFSIDCDDQQFWDFLRSCNVTNVPASEDGRVVVVAHA
jgi:hypothetical protein